MVVMVQTSVVSVSVLPCIVRLVTVSNRDKSDYQSRDSRRDMCK
jgi:hypothetical protein